MSEVKAILLVPAEGDPHGLLKLGPCGARPPMAYQESGTGIWRPYRGPLGEGHPENNDALVLACDGEPVPEGLDRANRVWVGRWCGYLLDWSVDDVREYGAALVIHLGGGTLVLLDAEGKEISCE